MSFREFLPIRALENNPYLLATSVFTVGKNMMWFNLGIWITSLSNLRFYRDNSNCHGEEQKFVLWCCIHLADR